VAKYKPCRATDRQFIGALVEAHLARIKRSSIQKPHLTCNTAGARHWD
jgi:hypothetical protein